MSAAYGNAMKKAISEDIRMYGRDPSLLNFTKLLVISPGFSAVILMRIQRLFFECKMLFPAYLMRHVLLRNFGIDVQPGVSIGLGLKIDHPVGIVIGPAVILGDRVTIMGGVSLGMKNPNDFPGPRNPIIGNDVTIGANSSIFGLVKIESSTMVKSHSLIFEK